MKFQKDGVIVMLAFDLAEKNKREAAIQYIRLLNQKNPENLEVIQ